jgi:RNA polymerase sigma factor (sigma-70 family)
MSTPTDQQLIQYIGQGRRDALAQLFDRYSADLYDYLSRLVGDRDQAARLLDTVFMRVPGAAPGFQARDSVRGWLYSIARETGLDWLRQRGWLDGLPPGDEAIQPGLQGDVWKAARAMPAFFRAVLITEELQPLSPTEKARALGVNRTDLARLIEEARRSFNRIYDAQARSEGRPTSDRINTDTVWNARRRLPVEGGSLFGFLPAIEFPESLKQNIRRHVVEAMTPPIARPLASDAVDDPGASKAPPPVVPPVVLVPPPTPQQPSREYLPPVEYPPANQGPFGGLGGGSMTALAALIGVALALLICGAVFLLTQNRGLPSITGLQPPNGSTVQQAPEINVFAVYQSQREIDPAKSGMQIDGSPVLPQFVSSSLAWTGPLAPGSHSASVLITDLGGNSASQSWSFVVAAQGTPIPPPTGIGSVTPIASVTPIFPITPQLVTVTPIIVPGTPTPPFFTPTFPPPPPPTAPFNTLTPCTVGGVAGYVFNDLNGNGVRDPNEPGLAGVVVNLLTQTNSVVAVNVADTFGNYRFNNVPFGQYRVQAVTPVGWTATTPVLYQVNLFGCGTASGFNFGFWQTPVVPTFTSTPIFASPTPTTPPGFVVTGVSAFVTPTFSTTCPQTFTFNGAITTNGPGTVAYQWVRYDGSLTPIQNLTFGFATTLNVVPDSLTLGAPGFVTTGWERLMVLSPNSIGSVPATFNLNCPPATIPTNTPTLTLVPPPTIPTATPTVTETPTVTPTVPVPFTVTASNAFVSPSASVTCPETFVFTGDITVTGTGTVNYQWVQSDSVSGPAQTLTFLVPGTQSVAAHNWNIPGSSPFVFSGWAQIQISSPNAFTSNQANFTLNCP